ncbi:MULTISPECIES: hypothetical protein [Bacillus]|nr:MULTISPECIES: hypothetical protein [Bacillus]EOP96248.1 hypothetical protein IIY_03842 [Bacillus cereus VD140]MCU5716373.1 hypothetical protein [Bacillus cereus]MDA1845499.1 hypothetical protein [Bacillus cereus]MDF9531606.1 hypothetical protein [Bacillus cereus]
MEWVKKLTRLTKLVAINNGKRESVCLCYLGLKFWVVFLQEKVV